MLTSSQNNLTEISRTVFDQITRHFGPIKLTHKSNIPLGKYYDLQFAAAATEKAMAPHSSILAWKTLWMEEPGGLQSMGS